jgi:hypothetical protein
MNLAENYIRPIGEEQDYRRHPGDPAFLPVQVNAYTASKDYAYGYDEAANPNR